METLIMHPENKEQLAALKAIAKALKITFKTSKNSYNPDFVTKINQGDEDFKAGKGKKITLEELNSLWK